MLCCLCLRNCDDNHHELLDAQGVCNELCQKTIKYFEEDLSFDISSNSVLCTFCSNSITDFYVFQRSIVNVHEEYERRLLSVTLDSQDGEFSFLDESARCDTVKAQQKQQQQQTVAVQNTLKSALKIETDPEPGKSTTSRKRKSVSFNITAEEKTHTTKLVSPAASDDESSQQSPDDSTSAKKRRRTRTREPVANEAEIATKSSNNSTLSEDMQTDFSCEDCAFVANDVNTMLRHGRNVHKKKMPHVTCCGRRFYTRPQFIEHMQRHQRPQTYSCRECKQQFQDAASLQLHINASHNSSAESHNCKICQQNFKDDQLLQEHLKQHTEVHNGSGICPHCLKEFQSENLQAHILREHAAVLLKCEHCNEKFTQDIELTNHMKTMHCNLSQSTLKSEDANIELNTKQASNRQKQQLHASASSPAINSDAASASTGPLEAVKTADDNEECDYLCAVCKKGFKTPLDLKIHRSIH